MKLKLNNENNDDILTPFYISIRLDYGKVLASKFLKRHKVQWVLYHKSIDHNEPFGINIMNVISIRII